MITALTSFASDVGQLIVVVLIFIFVLVLTAWVTKWIGNYQKDRAPGENVEILETKRIAPNKLIEIVRIGDRYFALALGKEETTLISEIDKSSLNFIVGEKTSFSFKEFLEKAKDNGEENSK